MRWSAKLTGSQAMEENHGGSDDRELVKISCPAIAGPKDVDIIKADSPIPNAAAISVHSSPQPPHPPRLLLEQHARASAGEPTMPLNKIVP